MTIRECEYKLERLKADLEYYSSKKNRLFELTQPRSKTFDRISVQGGKREDKLVDIFSKIEKIDYKIDNIKKEITIFEKWLVETKNIILKYYPEEYAKVIRLRESGKSWEIIAKLSHYSIRQSKRIYHEFKEKKTSIDY
ncbi:MAG: hypothetical protein II393_03975 [Cytophagales bacterium]|nr:hypothetical protein [Cytophagales bacterium]